MAQSVERFTRNEQVGGPNPPTSSIFVVRKGYKQLNPQDIEVSCGFFVYSAPRTNEASIYASLFCFCVLLIGWLKPIVSIVLLVFSNNKF